MSDASVLHLITRYLNGGAERTTDHAIEALRTANTDYDLHLGTGAEHDADRLMQAERSGVQTVVFHSLRHYNLLSSIVSVFGVAKYLYRHDIDIIHTHSTEAGIVGRWAGFLARTPVTVHEIHGDPVTADQHPLVNRLVRVAERASAPVTDLFIVKSKRIRETYLDRRIGSRDQYKLIYHGVDINRFDVSCTETDDGTLRLLYVGRLAEGKGLFDLLDAIERTENVNVRIAGDGPLAEALEASITERLLPIELLGYREDIPELLASSDALVLPSYREGTPRVITEALAAGRPVVSTNISGIPEQVRDGETGYLIEPGDVDALVDRIQKLMIPERRRSFGERARESVEKFSISTAKRRHQELYADLIMEL